jgi:hypothetical protein
VSRTSSDEIAALRAEIRKTRADLGATAEALAAKTDIKARARESAMAMRERLSGSANGARGRMRESAQSAKDRALAGKDRALARRGAGRDRGKGLSLAPPDPDAPPTAIGDPADLSATTVELHTGTGSGRMRALTGRAKDMGGRAADVTVRMKGTVAHPGQWSETTKRKVVPLASVGVAAIAGAVAGVFFWRRRR